MVVVRLPPHKLPRCASDCVFRRDKAHQYKRLSLTTASCRATTKKNTLPDAQGPAVPLTNSIPVPFDAWLIPEYDGTTKLILHVQVFPHHVYSHHTIGDPKCAQYGRDESIFEL